MGTVLLAPFGVETSFSWRELSVFSLGLGKYGVAGERAF
jgi:hypothetical protein